MTLPPELARLKGLPYRYGGRGFADGGVDCWGLARLVWKAEGLPVPPVNLVSEEDSETAWNDGRDNGEWVRLDRPEPWALCLLERPGMPLHCGVVLSCGTAIMHINHGGVHVTPLDSRILPNGKSYYRYAGN